MSTNADALARKLLSIIVSYCGGGSGVMMMLSGYIQVHNASVMSGVGVGWGGDWGGMKDEMMLTQHVSTTI